MIVALVLLVLLGISVLANMSHFLSGLVPMKTARSNSVGPRLEEVSTEDNGAASKIAVIGVEGIITDRALDQGL